MNVWTKGQLIRVKGVFTDSAGAPIDPTAVVFKYKNPAGTVTTLTYGVDNALVKDSTGNYHVDVSVSSVGTWYYRYESTGTGQAAKDGEFYVDASAF